MNGREVRPMLDRPPIFGVPACAGVRLLSIPGLTSLTNGRAPHTYTDKLGGRNADFITCLTSGRETRATYDLRILSRPYLTNPSRGQISVDILCRLDDGRADEPFELAVSTAALLQAQFPECAFRPLSTDEVASTLRPFKVNQVVSLHRRTSLERLDTLRSGRSQLAAGFIERASESDTSSPVDDSIFHVFPFLPNTSGFEVLFPFLLSMDDCACISVRLSPAALTDAEELAIEGQIARCERYAQVMMGSVSDDISGLRPTLRRQAELLQQYQQRMLFGLRDNAALLNIEIASPSRVPQPLIDLVGSHLSAPAGGARTTGAEPVQLYLAGGYDVHVHDGDDSRRIAFEQAAIAPLPRLGAPWGLERIAHLFDSSEAALAFRLPCYADPDLPGIAVRSWRTLPAPAALPDSGIPLGLNCHQGRESELYLAEEDRRRHIYVIGQTGTGKTTLLRNMILRDMEEGEGLCVVDPHGDLYADLLGRIPAHRRDDVVLLDPTDSDFPVGINLLECESEAERYFVAQEVVGIFSRLLADDYGHAAPDYAGPMFYQQVRMNLLLLMSKAGLPGTFLDFYSMFQVKDYWQKWTPSDTADPTLRQWVDEVLPKMNYTRVATDSGASMGMYIGSKFEQLIFDPRLRNIFGQRRSTIDLRDIVDDGKILLVNLAKGHLTEQNARFLGMVFLAKMVGTILSRVDVSEARRKPFHLYVDEFQSVATEGFITLLSEARKFGVDLVLANQFLSQVQNQRIIDAVFGNVGTLVAFRLGHSDARLLGPHFEPSLNEQDFIGLPNWEAYVRTLAGGERTKPFNVSTTLPGDAFDPAIRDYVRTHSRANYARPRLEVESNLLPPEL